VTVINGTDYDLSTYAGRQAARDANPGLIVDATSAFNPSTGVQIGGTSSSTVTSQAQQQLAAGINSLLGAIASGNKAAFDEAVRQFNELLGVSAAGLTGMYQGQPTLAAAGLTGTFQGRPTLQAQQQAYQQQIGAIQAAAGLQANPFRQAQVIGQLGRLLGGQGVAGFQSPGMAMGQTDFSGMGNMQRLIDDIRGGPGAINSQSTQSVLDAIPTPNKLNSVEFFRSSPNTQNLVLQGMQEKYGLSPDDSLSQIRNTLPIFSSPTTFGSVRR